jgi:hypothetical protein
MFCGKPYFILIWNLIVNWVSELAWDVSCWVSFEWVSEWVSEWVGPGRLLLGVFWLSQLGRQIVSVRAQVEPLGDPHSCMWTQAAISTVIILTTSSPLSGDETNSTTFGDERHSRLELMWCSDGTMHYETVHSGSEEWSCVLQYTFEWLINCKHQEFQA